MKSRRGFVGTARLRLAAGIRKYTHVASRLKKEKNGKPEPLTAQLKGKYPRKEVVLSTDLRPEFANDDIQYRKIKGLAIAIGELVRQERLSYSPGVLIPGILIPGRRIFGKPILKIIALRKKRTRELAELIRNTKERNIVNCRRLFRFFYINTQEEIVFTNTPDRSVLGVRFGYERIPIYKEKVA